MMGGAHFYAIVADPTEKEKLMQQEREREKGELLSLH